MRVITLKGYTLLTKKFALAAVLAAGALVMTACGGDDNNSSTPPSTPNSPSTSETTSAGGGTVDLSVADFTKDFSAMAKLKDVAAAGQGKIAVILPDTVTSARYTQFDAPYLQQAFEAAGLSKDSDFTIQNAQGSDATQLTIGPGGRDQRGQGPHGRPARLRCRRPDRELRQVSRRRRDRLRPAHPRRHPRLLRELRQRQGRRAHRQGPGPVRERLERHGPEGHRDGWGPDRQQRHLVPAGL